MKLASFRNSTCRIIRFALGLVLGFALSLGAGKASDEQDPPPMAPPDHGDALTSDPGRLFERQEVQERLKLTDEQTAKLVKIVDDYGRQIEAKVADSPPANASEEERAKKEAQIRQSVAKLRDQEREEFEKVLTLAQLQRFNLIISGVDRLDPVQVLQRKDVQKELELSDAQCQKLAELAEQSSRQMDIEAGNTSLVGLNKEERAQKEEELKEAFAKSMYEADDQVRLVLNPDQLHHLKLILLRLGGSSM